MINVLFFVQYSSQGSSSRGIQSGGVILDFGDLCDEQYIRKLCKGRYKFMYQVGRGFLKDVKSMTLEEFEAIFYPNGWLGTLEGMKHLLGYGDIPTIFRKDIINKYGPDAGKGKPKTTTVYNAGQIIKGVDNVNYLYVGKFEEIKISLDGNLEYNTNGHLYIPTDWLCRKYGSLVTTSAMSALDVVGDFLASYVHNYSRLEKYLLANKRKALDINKNMLGLNVGWLMGNDGINTINRVAKRTSVYSRDRSIVLDIKYNLK